MDYIGVSSLTRSAQVRYSRLGSQDDTDEDGDGPDPLDGEGDLVSPLGLVVDESTVDTGAYDLADDPAEVDVGGKEWSEAQGHDFGRVRYGHRLEGTPGETEEDVADESGGEVLGEELDEEETGESDEGDHHRRAVSHSLGCPSGDLKTENLTDLDGDGKTGLPASGDLVLVVRGVVRTELLGESLVGVELTKEQGVVTLHNDGARVKDQLLVPVRVRWPRLTKKTRWSR